MPLLNGDEALISTLLALMQTFEYELIRPPFDIATERNFDNTRPRLPSPTRQDTQLFDEVLGE
jgi:hypothetical protein